jgi:endoglucanase
VSEGNDALSALTDPENKIIYEMHQYLDSDGSGTNEDCVNNTIGSSRLESATSWLRSSGKVGILGEFAGGSNTVCEEAVVDMVTYMGDNNDVWLGGLFWGGGPWWGDYIFSMEPPSGTSYLNMLPLVLPLI